MQSKAFTPMGRQKIIGKLLGVKKKMFPKILRDPKFSKTYRRRRRPSWQVTEHDESTLFNLFVFIGRRQWRAAWGYGWSELYETAKTGTGHARSL
jgi:hypothetical protein